MVTTIAERVARRHFANHLRFMQAQIRKPDEKEEPSPLSSGSESEDEDQ
jgi:hypothetical protein